ncbi:MAG: NAD-dependent epimerase/dehydratase family protein [Acidimicrobiales bacterium]
MAHALVTGATGFVGPHLVAHLTECGDTVIGSDPADPSRRGPDLLDFDGWRGLVADAAPDVIYHLAGWSNVGASWANPRQVWRVNTEGTLAVLEAADGAGVARVVIVSSADVYGPLDPASMPILDEQPTNPASPYGASKAAAEVLALQFDRSHDLDVVIARPFNHIGPGQSPGFVVAAFAQRIAEAELAGGGEVRHGDLSARRDFTDVRDTVRAYRLLAERGTPGRTYNICTGHDVAMSEVLEQLRSPPRSRSTLRSTSRYSARSTCLCTGVGAPTPRRHRLDADHPTRPDPG